MNRALLMIAAAALVAGSLTACRTAPRHAPAFKDLHELNEVKIDPAAVEESLESEQMKTLMALFHAMQFTPAELRRIRDTGNVRLLLSAVSVTDGQNPLAPELLRLAIAKAPDDPAPPAALAYWDAEWRSGEAATEPEFLEALSRWRNLEPENSVPYYLEAGWWAYSDKFDAADQALAEASQHPQFETHCAALRRDIAAAADFLGYPNSPRATLRSYSSARRVSLLPQGVA